MEKLDKVIAGLGCCADLDRSCDDCPYTGAEYCEVALMRDALVVIGGLRIASTAAGVLEKYRPAFEELAKGVDE